MIRAAHPDDAPAIAAIWNAVIAQPHITFTTDTKSDTAVAQMIAERAWPRRMAPSQALPPSAAFAADRVIGTLQNIRSCWDLRRGGGGWAVR